VEDVNKALLEVRLGAALWATSGPMLGPLGGTCSMTEPRVGCMQAIGGCLASQCQCANSVTLLHAGQAVPARIMRDASHLTACRRGCRVVSCRVASRRVVSCCLHASALPLLHPCRPLCRCALSWRARPPARIWCAWRGSRVSSTAALHRTSTWRGEPLACCRAAHNPRLGPHGYSALWLGCHTRCTSTLACIHLGLRPALAVL
jgi:hypothetical protein